MNFLHKSMAACLLLILHTTSSAIFIHASVWSKTLDNGVTQKIYLFGDRHLYLKAEHPSNHARILQLTEQEQQAILNHAQALHALVLVEDAETYVPSTGLVALKKLLYKHLIPDQQTTIALLGLTKKCTDNGIRAISTENRMNAFIGQELFLKLRQLPYTYLGICVGSWLTNKYIFKDNTFHTHLCNHWGKYLAASLAPLLLVLDPLFAAKDDYIETAALAEYNETLKAHSDLLKKGYPLISGGNVALAVCGWQVDVLTIRAILENNTTENIFVCAGDLHVRDTAYYLQQHGYVQEKMVVDRVAQVTNGYNIDLEQPINVDAFLAPTQEAVSVA